MKRQPVTLLQRLKSTAAFLFENDQKEVGYGEIQLSSKGLHRAPPNKVPPLPATTKRLPSRQRWWTPQHLFLELDYAVNLGKKHEEKKQSGGAYHCRCETSLAGWGASSSTKRCPTFCSCPPGQSCKQFSG